MQASDDFNRADDPDVGAAWFQQSASALVGIASNQAVGGVGSPAVALYQAVSFGRDQFSSALLRGQLGGPSGGQGVIVRGSFASREGYIAYVDNATSLVLVRSNTTGIFSILQIISSLSLVDGDRLTLEVVGTTLRVLVNGVQVGTSTVDSVLTSGAPGIYFGVYALLLDDWEGVSYQESDPPSLSWQTTYQQSGARSGGMVPSGMEN